MGIVGAGLSGLRCASFLLETGKFEVTIIEGRNRIGGRVHQVQLPNGHLVDCGPNWIHGTEDNPILDIATEEKVPLKGWDENSHIYNENGDLVGQNEGERYSTMMWDIIQDAFAYSNKHSPTINSETSLFEFFQQEVQQRIPDSEPDYERKRDFILQMAEMWGAFVGNPVHTQSLKFFWLEECIEGGKFGFQLPSLQKSSYEPRHDQLQMPIRELIQDTRILTRLRKSVLRWNISENSTFCCTTSA